MKTRNWKQIDTEELTYGWVDLEDKPGSRLKMCINLRIGTKNKLQLDGMVIGQEIMEACASLEPRDLMSVT